MFNLFKKTKEVINSVIETPKTFTVEEIHAEVDSAQDRLLQEADEFIASLNIPTETNIERKANLMKALGFTASETVHQAAHLENVRKNMQQQLISTEEVANRIRSYHQEYPENKFLTITEMERICDKYGLIMAPVNRYIKDVPEKNLLEMHNTHKRSFAHIPKNHYTLKIDKFFSGVPESIKNLLKGDVYLGELTESEREYFFRGVGDEVLRRKLHITYGNYIYTDGKLNVVDKTQAYIAAPPSHFNLEGLQKDGKTYAQVTSYEVKDPIVFEYMVGDIVRIITKWGTDDDQSYLDPALTNEKMN